LDEAMTADWIPQPPQAEQYSRARICVSHCYPGTMPALSIRAPYSWLCAAGWKPVENRKWKPPILGRDSIWLAIHCGLRVEPGVAEKITAHLGGATIPIVTSAVIGAMRIDGCFTEADELHPLARSPWFVGPTGWVIGACVLLRKPIVDVDGSLGCFRLPHDVQRLLERQWLDAEHRQWKGANDASV
jgi:hypothetical protein